MSDRQKRRRRPPAEAILSDTPIWCPACLEEHPASAFNKESRRFSGLHSVCRAAQALARQTPEGRKATQERNQRRWSDPNYRAESRERNRQRRLLLGGHDLRKARSRLQDIVREWKRQGCVDCPVTDVRLIDPDHKDARDKAGNVSRLVQLCVSEDRIRAELAKCSPRCARCHRVLTRQDRMSSWRQEGARLPPSWQRRLDMQNYVDVLKQSSGCMDCGWNASPWGLDFDHVRGAKVMSVSSLIAHGRDFADVIAEIDKCECVCANCHRIRTIHRAAS